MIVDSTKSWQGKALEAFHLTVRPVGGRCNMDCAYCPYHEPASDDPSRMMSLQVLERTIRQAIEGQNTPQYVFSWQGGEPTLAGLGFFQEALALQKQFAPESTEIVNEIQTNGLLLDAEWADFVRANDIRIAISTDGPPDAHDAFRRDQAGRSTSRSVMRSALFLHQRQIPFTALVAVHSMSVRDPVGVYEHLRDRMKARSMHFFPVVERRDGLSAASKRLGRRDLRSLGSKQLRPGRSGLITNWSVDFDEYGEFMKTIFDIWRVEDVGEVTIPTFDALLAQWLDEPTRFCEMGQTCGSALVVDWDGAVYPCPYCLDAEAAIGNVRETPLGELARSSEQVEFGRAKATLSRQCEECEFLFACHGGCPRRRYGKTQGGKPIDMLCDGLLAFHRHVGPFFRVFARSVQENA